MLWFFCCFKYLNQFFFCGSGAEGDNKITITGDYPNGRWKKETRDKKNRMVAIENYDGSWWKRQYNNKGEAVSSENSYGEWDKREYDNKGNIVYWEDESGVWKRMEYDDNNQQVYYETDDGVQYDYRKKKEPVSEGLSLLGCLSDLM
jgi:hypothetical protein